MGSGETHGVTTIVIGAGLAGLVAALRQQQAGAQTLLLAKGLGSLSWTNGCIDLWPAANPLSAIQVLQSPHPYSLLTQAAIERACTWLQAQASAAGYPLVGSPNRSVLLPTAIGTWTAAALLPLTMVAAERNNLQHASVLVAGFRELRDFYPPLLATRLVEQGIDARPVYLTMPPTERTRDFTTNHLSRLFERPDFRAAVGQQLRAIRGSAQIILLPAVLGVDHALSVVSELQELSGARIAEIPTLPTVVPGLRLERILRHAFEQAGGRLQINAEVVRGEWEGQRLRAVWTKAAAREQRHSADQFILATGGIAGGGFRADYPNLLRETALDLPLVQPPQRADWFAPHADDPHLVFQAGIAVNAAWQPLAADNSVVAINVRVAGAALGQADFIRQRCLNGIALATGWAASAAT